VIYDVAIVWVYDEDSKGLYVSNDYGRTLHFLTSKVFYVVESSTNSQIMYGIGRNIFQKSYSGGKKWDELPSSRFIFKPVFVGSDGVYRTWDLNGRGSEDGYPYRIEQIQIDPQNTDIIYVLTCKGLFKSSSGGRSFVLLPLGIDMLLWINKVCVDPIDGRYIYTQCGMNSLYRSNDGGCSWIKLRVPLN
jgi:hypothetical protein